MKKGRFAWAALVLCLGGASLWAHRAQAQDTPTETPTATETATETPTLTVTATSTVTSTVTKTATRTSTKTPIPTKTRTPTPTRTPTNTRTTVPNTPTTTPTGQVPIQDNTHINVLEYTIEHGEAQINMAQQCIADNFAPRDPLRCRCVTWFWRIAGVNYFYAKCPGDQSPTLIAPITGLQQ